MPVGRYIRGLNAYDLLGNLLPGIVALVVTLGAFANPPIPDNLGEYALFGLVAYLAGSLIQSFASTAVGDRKHFDWTMSGAEQRTKSTLAEVESTSEQDDGEDSQQDDGEDIEQEETDDNRLECKLGDGNGPIWKCAHPFLGPFLWWLRPARGQELEDAILVNRIWEYLIDTHEIPFRTKSYSVLYHVMSSRVDNIQSPSRATRMQAIRNFNRGMWIASWYSLMLLIWVFLADWFFSPSKTIPLLDHTYRKPVIFEYLEATWILIPVAIVGVMVFWLQAESSEEDYIEYLFADYVVSVASDSDDIAFAEDTTLQVAGKVSADVSDLSDPLLSSKQSGTGSGREGTCDGPAETAQNSVDSEKVGDKNQNTGAGTESEKNN